MNTPTPRTDERKASFALDTIRQLEAELSVVTEQLKAAQDGWHDEITKGLSEIKRAESIYTKAQERAERAEEQRNRLAEVLQKLNEYDLGDIPVGVVRRCKEALQFLNPDHTVDSNDMTAAVKGGADES